jgi:hypothetical protein
MKNPSRILVRHLREKNIWENNRRCENNIKINKDLGLRVWTEFNGLWIGSSGGI